LYKKAKTETWGPKGKNEGAVGKVGFVLVYYEISKKRVLHPTPIFSI
tara:strand:- start:371 stop:511 length:141 start_codon:yes stop_codon:yes gene_type:complete